MSIDNKTKKWVKAAKAILLGLAKDMGEVNNPWVLPLEFVVFPATPLEDGMDAVLTAAKALAKELVRQLNVEMSLEYPSNDIVKKINLRLAEVNRVVHTFNSNHVPQR